jgi:hypothetical protein
LWGDEVLVPGPDSNRAFSPVAPVDAIERLGDLPFFNHTGCNGGSGKLGEVSVGVGQGVELDELRVSSGHQTGTESILRLHGWLSDCLVFLKNRKATNE